MSCQDPDAPENWPRNLFVWRSNLLGSSGKGHEYFLKHLLGTEHGVLGKDLGAEGRVRSKEERWHDDAPRASSTCWSPSTSACPRPRLFRHRAADRELVREGRPQHLGHASLHPPADRGGGPGLREPVRLGDLQDHRAKFSEVAPEILGVETDVVAVPILHDTAAEMAQPQVLDWKKGECELIPGRTAPNFVAVERDYPASTSASPRSGR
jgi:nitrate reductase / nitrite oxidoreductase, alpha subunit